MPDEITPDTVPEQLVAELRNQFLSQNDSDFHPKDLERAKTDDFWLKRYLAHQDNNVANALKMMCSALKWRKEFGANEVNENNINMKCVNVGSVYPHGRDVDGKCMFVIRGKKHIRGAFDMKDIKRMIVYWMERLEKSTGGDIITLFFDLDGAGLKNLDMDFMQFLIGLLNENYPYFLNYIIIFEMHWVLNAAFKIIKSWLPPKALQKLKFVGKKDITTYVPATEALTAWGGTNEYEFQFVPEQKRKDSINKKVTFNANSKPVENGIQTSKKSRIGPLETNPSEIITFIQQGSEILATVDLLNRDSSNAVCFKLKTTSPEKFRVKPSTGILSPNATVKVSVYVLPGYKLIGNLDKEKFLVMSSMVTQDTDTLDLTEHWKNMQEDKVYLQRLKCVQNSGKIKQKAPAVPNGVKSNDALSQLTKSLKRIERLLLSLLILSVIIAISIFYVFNCSYVQHSIKNDACTIRKEKEL